jgi:hypothetical protein
MPQDTLQPALLAHAGPDTGQARLRAELAALGLDESAPRLTDHDVLALLDAPLTSGRLTLAPAAALKLLGQGKAPAAGPVPPDPPRAAPAAAPAPPPEEPALDLDVPAMVQTLLAAARDGVPFCEECAKAAAAAAAAAA